LVDEQTIHGHNDGGHANYVDIDAANIEGDIDAPCDITIRPAADLGAGVSVNQFWMAMVGPKAGLKYWGEIDMSYDAACSNDSRYLMTAPGGTAWVSPGISYVMGSTLLSGELWRFRMMVRNWPTDAGGGRVQTGFSKDHPVVGERCIVDLGRVYMTHIAAGDYAGDTLYIGAEFNPMGTVAGYAEIDFIALFPEHEYGFMLDHDVLAAGSYDYRETTDRLRIKGTDDFPHHAFTESYTGPENIGSLAGSPRGVYPRLMPGEDNRVWFLFGESDKHDITRQFKVSIDYLPQFLTPLE